MEIGVHRLNNKEGNLRIPRFSTYRFKDLCMHLKFHALSHPSLPFVFHLLFIIFILSCILEENILINILDRSKSFRVLLFPPNELIKTLE